MVHTGPAERARLLNPGTDEERTSIRAERRARAATERSEVRESVDNPPAGNPLPGAIDF